MRATFSALVLIVTCVAGIPDASAQSSSLLQTGYIKLLPNQGTPSPAGVAIFGWRSNGVLVTEAGVPSTTAMKSGRIFVDVNGAVNTGMALANPTNSDAVVSFYFTDATGHDFGAGSFMLAANHQLAAFLTDSPFGLNTSLTGSFTFNSTIPIATVALRSLVNERSETLITTLPVSPIGTGFGGNAVLIPHFADGAGWSTQVVLLNPSDAVQSGTVLFLGQGSKNGIAQPVKVVVNGNVGTAFNYSIPPRSAYRMVTQTARSNTEIGSVRIAPAQSNGAPSGVGIFSYKNGGVTVSAASVSASPAAKAVRLYVESSGVFGQVNSIQTGLTISNTSSTKVTVRLEVMTIDGTSTGLTTSVDIAGNGQIAKFANELFPQLPSPFKGVLRLSAPSAISVVGLRGRYNERGDMLITTTPPYDEASPAMAETDFPHFAVGSGYSTQLILLSTGPAETGSIQLLSPNGDPVAGPSLQQP